MRFREEVINVELARALAGRGLSANAETIEGNALPDVLIDLGGVRFVIEGRVETKRTSLLKDAQERIADGIADLSLAILYNRDLANASSQAALAAQLERETFSGTLFFYAGGGIEATPFDNKSLGDIAEIINNAFRLYVQDDTVRAKVAEMEAAMSAIVKLATSNTLFFASETLITRLSAALGIDGDGETEKVDDEA